MIVQVIANALFSISIIAPVAVGFGVIYSCARFFHFSHGITFTCGAYVAYLLTVQMGVPVLASAMLAVVAGAGVGCAMHLGVYRPLKDRGATPTMLLLASLGVYIVSQNVISLVFGDDTKTLRMGPVREGFSLVGARITGMQMISIVASAAAITGVGLLLTTTKLGKGLRAIASDQELAAVSGIESSQLILWAFAIGSGLAAIAGILAAMNADLNPTMGMGALLTGVVAVIVGGSRGVFGPMLGACVLGVSKHLCALTFGTQWEDVSVFIILLLVLLVKPAGLLGRAPRVSNI